VKIVVLVKWSPDASAERSYNSDYTVDRDVEGRLSELDEYAVEQALRLVERGVDAELVYLTMGPSGATEALRAALSMGGDRAVHVLDDAIHGSDYLASSLVLATAIQKLGFDLVIGGMASTEAGGGVLPAMLAERLSVQQATLAGEILSIDAASITIRRDGDFAAATVTADLPAVLSVTDQTGDARYASFRGIMAAKKKKVETWDLAALGLSGADVGLAAAATAVESATKRPPRQAGQIVKDQGEGGRELAAFLAAQRFI
jgi:electron transfer flavoprotein beta subunit